VSLVCDDGEHESDCRTPAQGILDGNRGRADWISPGLSFRNGGISKRRGVILGAIAARTQRIDIASGIITTPGATPITYGRDGCDISGRIRATVGFWASAAVTRAGCVAPAWTWSAYRGLEDYVGVLRQLWRGQTVSYNGPLGDFPHLQLEDVGDDFVAPPVWFGTLGQPVAARTAARSFDGVLLPPVFTPDATHTIVARLRAECAAVDRDPASLRICQSVITAPDLDDTETRTLAHARGGHLSRCTGLR